MHPRVTHVRVLGVALLAAAWLVAGPRQLGGPVSYLSIAGNSMRPTLHGGDLALVRAADRYRSGDVVAFQSPDLRRVVLHRIVGEDDGRFVTRGDGNDWTDAYRPTPEDVLGRLWLRIPDVGAASALLANPWIAAGLAAAALALGASARRRRRGEEAGDGPRTPRLPIGDVPAGVALKASAGVLAAALLLAILGFTRPAIEPAPTEAAYRHTGAFSYRAPVSPGPAYPRGELRSGQPVFLRLVDRMTVAFDYRFQSDAPHDVRGTARLDVVLSASSGWRHTQVAAARSFQGAEVRLRGTVDLRKLLARRQRIEAATGVTALSYEVAIEPRIEVSGSLEGTALRDAFGPRLVFPLESEYLAVPRSPDPEGASDPFAPVAGGAVQALSDRPASLGFGPARLPVAAARGAGLVLAAAAAAAVLWFRRRLPPPGDETAQIERRFGRWLVQAEGEPHLGEGAVPIATMDALIRVAEAFDQPVVSYRGAGSGVHVVRAGGVAYWYRPSRGHPPAALPTRPAVAVAGEAGT